MAKISCMKGNRLRVERRVLSLTFRVLFKFTLATQDLVRQQAEDLSERIEKLLNEYGTELPKSDPRRFQGIAGRPKRDGLPIGIYDEDGYLVANWVSVGKLVRQRFKYSTGSKLSTLDKALGARLRGIDKEKRRVGKLAKLVHQRLRSLCDEYSPYASIGIIKEKARPPRGGI